MAALTWGETISQITYRLNRDDVDQFARIIAPEKIDQYKSECFYHGRVSNESITTDPLKANPSVYDFPDGWEQVTEIYLLIGVWRTLTQIAYDEMMEMDVNQPAVRGVPTYWAPIG